MQQHTAPYIRDRANLRDRSDTLNDDIKYRKPQFLL